MAIKRDIYLNKLINKKHNGLIKVVTGIRRCGKSDLGLRNARLNFRQLEETHAMENIIFNELKIRGFNVDVGVVTLNKTNEKTVKSMVSRLDKALTTPLLHHFSYQRHLFF